MAVPASDVVDVMLADHELVRASQTGVDLQVEVSAFAVVCRYSSTSDGLATAWNPRMGSQYLGRWRRVVAQACEPGDVLPRMGPWKRSRDAEDHLAWP
jgi:hypothetical protein